MLTLDGRAGSGEAPAASLPPTLLAHALGNLLAERMADGSKGFAITQLCTALLDDSPEAGIVYVDRLLDCGVSVQSLYDTYIPRAAQQLGEMWSEDTLGFSDVTLGMTRLTEIFRRLSPTFLKTGERFTHSRRALFALTPGETHSLGIAMAADYFQKGGWAVRVELRADADELARIAGSYEFDMVGLSAGSRRAIPRAADTVKALRETIRPGVPIVLGGPLATLEKTAAEQIGADMAATAAVLALMEVEKGF
jgi:methanogenic corrinoid protein MtbC1